MNKPKRSRPARSRSRRKSQAASARARHTFQVVEAPWRFADPVAAGVAGTSQGRSTMARSGGVGGDVDANSARDRRAPAHPETRRKGHSRRTAHSAVADRRRQYTSRQSRPNVAGLPRSAPLAAVDMALRRRADLTRSAPSAPMAADAPARRPAMSVPLWRRLSEESARGITVFRRGGASIDAAGASRDGGAPLTTRPRAQATLPMVGRSSSSVAMRPRAVITTRSRSHGVSRGLHHLKGMTSASACRLALAPRA